MKEAAEYLTLARIARPRGNRGEVVAENLAGDPGCFEPGRQVEVLYADGTSREHEIDRAWEHSGRLVLGFAGFATIADAERLRQAEVRMARTALAPPADGGYFLTDLVGCRVIDEATGRVHGTVEDIYEPPGGVLLFSVVGEDRMELLVPFANAICRKVDIAARRIEVRLPEGMEELKA